MNINKLLLFVATLFFLLFAGLQSANAADGDTTSIQVHNAVDMTWFGNYDQWGSFPDGSETYHKVYLRYTLGCASTGCSNWDYTNTVDLRHRTGELDSTLQMSPSYRVGGNVVDSFSFSNDSTYTTFFNATTMMTDSTVNAVLNVDLFGDVNNPTTSTGNFSAWMANYWNYEYDTSGMIIDSNYVSADSTYYVNFTNWYNVFEVINQYELGRVITPYGTYMASGTNGYDNNWSHEFIFDVSDFVHLLKDSVEIRSHYSGWSSGFSATVVFDFIEGTPVREVIDIKNIYNGSSGYASGGIQFDTLRMPEKAMWVDAGTEQCKVRVNISGHGFDNSVGCAEFCPRTYEVFMNSNMIGLESMWDDQCGENPVFPQGGTWIYDRANWCPGTKTKSNDHNVASGFTPGAMNNFNVDIENYTWSGAQNPSYIYDVQLIQYKNPSKTYDVELSEILSPNNHEQYGRLNPICKEPKIRITNNGSATLTSLDVVYGPEGAANPCTYNWWGSLDFLESTVITIPHVNWEDVNISNPKFNVVLQNPNGNVDEWLHDNDRTVSFDMPAVYGVNALLIEVQTDNQGSQNAFNIKDLDGNVVYQRSYSQNNTVHSDTVPLPVGCYVFEFTDAAENGLAWWANQPAAGSNGYISLKHPTLPATLKTFNRDFGSKITHQFSVGVPIANLPSNQACFEPTNITDLSLQGFSVYPNPASDFVQINFDKELQSVTPILITDLAGKIVHNSKIESMGVSNSKINLENLNNGIYLVTALIDGVSVTKKLIVTK